VLILPIQLHVEDCPPFILKVLALALSTKEPKDSVYSRCYIIGGQNDRWKDVSNPFAQLLYAKGLVASPVARSVSLEEAGEGEIPRLMARNMLFRNERAKRLGFEARQVGLVEHLGKGLEDYSSYV
jgi:hypothetical protein